MCHCLYSIGFKDDFSRHLKINHTFPNTLLFQQIVNTCVDIFQNDGIIRKVTRHYRCFSNQCRRFSFLNIKLALLLFLDKK